MSNAYTAASLMIQSRNNCIFGRFAVSSGHTKKCAFSDGMTRSKGEMVLNLMNEHLSVRPFFVGDDYTIADIALYAYTHVAHESWYDLSNRPALKGVVGPRREPAGLRDDGRRLTAYFRTSTTTFPVDFRANNTRIASPASASGKRWLICGFKAPFAQISRKPA